MKLRFIILAGFLFFIHFVSAQSFYKKTFQSNNWVDSVFKTLSPQQKIAQLMVLRESGKSRDSTVFYDKEITAAIKKYNIGAICLFQGNPVQQANYINYFQSIAKTPMMICIDGETGLGMRMTDSIKKFPDQLTLGAVSDSSLIFKVGKTIGLQCKREGINVNYAPVVDINNNPNNPVINFRSFGEDKNKVALFGAQMMKGIQNENVMACAKHFPGHGDVSVDSHFDLPVINKSIAQLDSLELIPFKKLFKEGVGSVMIAHLFIPSIDATAHQPTSLSKKNVTGLLRNKLGFEGISFTDALEMQGVAKYYPQGIAAVQSLIAGNDMLCLPGNIDSSISAVMNATEQKKLSWNDVDLKVKKVLLAKYNLGLNNVDSVNTNNLTNDLNADVNKLRAGVAEKAITLLQLNNKNLLPLKRNEKIAFVGIGIDTANTFSSLLEKRYKADCFYFNYKQDATKENELLANLQNKYDVIIVGLHRFAKYPANNFGISNTAIDLIHQIQKNKNTINLVFGNPYVIKNFCDAPNLIECYEDDSIFQTKAFELLQGKILGQGKLPVTVCNKFHFGDGIVMNNFYPVTNPAKVGMNAEKLAGIDSIANDAIEKHATPGCVVLVEKDGKIVFNKAYGYLSYDSLEPVTQQTVYDLASVTKVSATTVSVMKLFEEGKLDIHKTLGDYLPWMKGTDKANLNLENVLMHQAGLVAFIPFYKETIDTLTGQPKPGFYKSIRDSEYSIRVAESMYMRSDWIDTMYKRILESKLGEPNKYIYSDNDFILLGKIVEQLTGKTLDNYASETFYKPLQMQSTTFKPRENTSINLIAPTEKEKLFRLQILRGDVHDPGAAMFGGVAGHAGLFSNAYDLSQLYEMLLNGGVWNGKRFLKKETINYFSAYHSSISRRGYGFDKPEKDNATNPDPYPSKYASPLAFGHTGFTGICVWVDPKYQLIYIFLSNRVNPDGGSNLKLSKLGVRRNIMDIIYESFLKKE
ncbi:MAG: glycoside hydrolase family 3 N-terminal domain-containing protein [Chitinophagaceae bacterium]